MTALVGYLLKGKASSEGAEVAFFRKAGLHGGLPTERIPFRSLVDWYRSEQTPGVHTVVADGCSIRTAKPTFEMLRKTWRGRWRRFSQRRLRSRERDSLLKELQRFYEELEKIPTSLAKPGDTVVVDDFLPSTGFTRWEPPSTACSKGTRTMAVR